MQTQGHLPFRKLFIWLFLTTGIFAIVGSLFTWGEGWLFHQTNLHLILIPLADLWITGPVSLLAAYGLWTKKDWGIYLSLFCCGIYVFGSALVYIELFWNGPPYPLKLLVPPIFGLGISTCFLFVLISNE